MSDPEEHIAAWEAAGLIDAPLAARLRAASAVAEVASVAEVPAMARPTSAGSFFGPVVTIGEVFAYLGLGFLLGAWVAFLTNVAELGNGHREAIMTGGLGLAALVMVGLGLILKRGDSRRRRAAGVAFVVATVLAAVSGEYLVQTSYLRNALQNTVPAVLVLAIATALALVLRRLLPAVTTQFALLGWLTGLSGGVLLWIQWIIFPASRPNGEGPGPIVPTPLPMGQLIGGAVWWLLIALGLGIVAIVEMRNAAGDQATGRRVGLTRFWAGLVAVVGLAGALTQSGFTGTDANGNEVFGRIIAPWVAEVLMLALALILVERAFRRNSTAFILAAAAGLIIALTDFNVAYLAKSTYIGLLIEGGILLAVGFGGDRLRRRLNRSGGLPGAVAPVTPVVPPLEPLAMDVQHEPPTIQDL
jgi:hypothetical protein